MTGKELQELQEIRQKCEWSDPELAAAARQDIPKLIDCIVDLEAKVGQGLDTAEHVVQLANEWMYVAIDAHKRIEKLEAQLGK